MHSGRSLFWTLLLLGTLAHPLMGQSVLGSGGDPNPSYPGLWAWYDASNGVNGLGVPPADGAPATEWHDRGYQVHNLTRTGNGSEPIYQEGVANGYPALAFQGGKYLWGNQSSEFGSIPGAKTLFFVAKTDSADGGYLFDGVTSSGRNALFTGQNSAPGKWVTFTGQSSISGPTVASGVYQVHSLIVEDGFQEHFINGVRVMQGTEPSQALKGMMLGARYSVSNFYSGNIAEVLVYEEQLTPIDRVAIENYLITKHPITEPPPGPEFVDVFWRSDGFYPQYRIPSIITLQNNHILAFAEGRESMSDHAKNDMVMKRSVDGGNTWSDPIVLWDAGNDCLNNPCVVQLDSIYPGRLLFMFQKYPYGCHESCVGEGYTGNICRSYLMWSDDNGLNWSAPWEITTQVKRPTGDTSICSGPGVGIQLQHGPSAGRIIFPYNHNGATGWKNYAVYSDDGGITWEYGEDADEAVAGVQGNEVQMVETVDGHLLMNARNTSGSYRMKARSTDGGETWSDLEQETQLIEPRCMASILRYTDPSDGFAQSRILYAGPNTTGGRSMGNVWISYDEGYTWPVNKLIYAGGYAYSQLTILDQKTIGVFFEKDGYETITLAKIPLKFITDGEDLLLHKEDYGFPSPGFNGVNPMLSISGSSQGSAVLEVSVSQARPLRNAFLIVGANRNQQTLFGVTLWVTQPFLRTFPMVIDSQGMGALDLIVPSNLSGRSACVQVGVQDSGAPSGGGWSATSASQIRFF